MPPDRASPGAGISTAVPWPAVSGAVGLLTARQAGSGDSQADILAGQSPGDVIAGLEVIAAALLNVLAPDDKGAGLLEAIGLLALTKDAEQAGGSA